MKPFAIVTFLLLFCFPVLAQDTTKTQVPETFEYVWEGQSFTMQKYFIVFLKSGPDRSHNEEKAAEIQAAHLAYLGDLYQKGIINLNGPTGGEGDIRGFSVYNVATAEEAVKYAENDPAVKSGRLVVEVHPWWLAKGSGVK